MNELRKILEGIFDEEEQIKLIDNAKDVHEFFAMLDALDKVGHKSKFSSRKYNEDALGNKLNVGDLVYIKSSSSNKFDVNEKFGIIFNINKEPDPYCHGTITVYVGKNRDFDKNIKYYEEGKINITNPYVIYKLATTSCMKSSEVFLVKKAKQVNSSTISKIL